MKIIRSGIDDRLLIVSQISPDSPEEVEITIGLPNIGDADTFQAHKAALDKHIIPALLNTFQERKKRKDNFIRMKTGKCPKCKTKNVTLTFEACPYQSDVNKDDTPIWQCADCKQNALSDI